MIIQTESLAKSYGETRALKAVDLGIEAGGIVGILGPNGAGKTTLVEIFEGLRTPTSGSVTVLGLDPTRRARDLKEKIGVLLQSTNLAPDLTVVEILQMYSAFYSNPIPTAAVLESVSLEEKTKQRVNTLSGGQQQRLAIGMALINNPDLIILDEPTTGLDPVARRQVHDIVAGFRKQGKTVLLTTHYIEEAEKLCDRVLMIKHGEIVADGTPFDLVGQAGGSSTLWIAVDGEFNPDSLAQKGCKPLGREGEHYKFATDNPADTIIALGEILEAQKVGLTDLRLKRPTLEDVYLDLVGEPADETSIH